jgi:TldD protein
MSAKHFLADLVEQAVQFTTNLGAEYADARAEQTVSTSIRLSNEEFERVATGIECAFGVRALVKGAWGFSSTNLLGIKNVRACSTDAFKVAKTLSRVVKEKAELSPTKTVRDHVKSVAYEPLMETETDKKLMELMHLSKTAQQQDKRVGAYVIYDDCAGSTVAVNSDGSRILADTSRLYVAVLAMASEAGKVTSCREHIGSCGGFELFKSEKIGEIAVHAARRAVRLLEARAGPNGKFTALLDPRMAGIFVHEAIGHACEADQIASGESILKGKIGEPIGSKLISIIDDPTVIGEWGSRKYDDECVSTKKRILVNHGILSDFINNRESAAKLNLKPNGGAIAESPLCRPIVRMSNLHVARGNHSFEELLEDIHYGIYLKGTRGGEANIANGSFQFTAEEAYLIEKGELTTPFVGATLSGSALETLSNVDAASRNFEKNVGFCSKSSQNVPTGTASPYLRLTNALLGG